MATSHLSLLFADIPVEARKSYLPSPNVDGGDLENPSEISKDHSTKFAHFEFLQLASTIFGSMRQKFHVVFWNTLKQLFPSINHIHDTKLIHVQTMDIVRLMCEGVTWKLNDTKESFTGSVLTAAKLGIHEFVNEVIKTNPLSALLCDSNRQGIFQLAVLYRQEKVFNLIHEMPLIEPGGKFPFKDTNGNNILHLAGKLLQPSRKDTGVKFMVPGTTLQDTGVKLQVTGTTLQVAGAALQMQRELQWFKAVENFADPLLRKQRNNEGRTPRELFTMEHYDLVEKAERWMKDTAQSCTVVAALIITVVFAAAITVPGGNDTQGIPNFSHNLSFLIFIISDALALFSSSTSVLMFLGIFTARYSEEDFLESLPKKLIAGLITLFISIAAMMVAFGAALQIVLARPLKWIIISIVLLACLPVTTFAWLQFPLLVDMVKSTYGPSLIRPKKKREKHTQKHVVAKDE